MSKLQNYYNCPFYFQVGWGGGQWNLKAFLLLVTILFNFTNEETAKAECVITFLDNFIFSGCHP
jgi:hypothetical protein